MISGLVNRNQKLKLAGSLFFFALILFAGAPAQATNALGDPVNRSSNAKGAGVAGLKAVEAETKAGDITVGSTTQVVVKFRNESAQEVRVGAVSLYPSSTVSTEVALNECGGGKEAIPAGAECAIVVSVKGLKIGNWRVEVLLRHDGKSKIVTAALLGTIAAGDDKTDVLLSDVEMIPNEIDFGSLNSSRPLVKSVIMRNITSEPIKVGRVNIEAAPQSGYSLSTDCGDLAAGQACMATVTWSPVTAGKSDGVLVVEHSGATRVSSVSLKGDYQPKAVTKANIFPDAVPGAGVLVSSQEEINFDKVTNEASMTVSLVNVGDQEMQLKDLSLGSSDKGLTIANTGCHRNTVLQPIEACALTLNWSPVRVGEIIEDVRIYHDGARGVLVIPVRGSSDIAVNKDTKAVVVSNVNEPQQYIQPVEKRQALEGFVISSHSKKKAIINGPGGSRVVSQGANIVLGGIEWKVNIVENAVEFLNGNDRVRLLFDRSLSSASRTMSAVSPTSTNSTGTASTTQTTTTTAGTAAQ
ncbi:MAG: choice-of-anchor D domain-containing protein [Alphaproteobacteria bacterium]|nr:choice-of-anchor D domain-containing protein [Alphaproteobacteria bacterium]